MAKQKGSTKVIPMDFYLDLCKWAYLDQISDEEMKRKAQKFFADKIKAEQDRLYYSKSLNAPTAAEREENRIKYADSKGIPESFRW